LSSSKQAVAALPLIQLFCCFVSGTAIIKGNQHRLAVGQEQLECYVPEEIPPPMDAHNV